MDMIKQVMYYGKGMCKMVFYRMLMLEEMLDKEKEEVREMMMFQGMLENMMEDMEEKREDFEEDLMRRDMMEDNMDDMQKVKMEMEKMYVEMKKMFESIDYVFEIQKRVRDFMFEGGVIRENMDVLMKFMSVVFEDGFCVDQVKYREFGRCDSAIVMECMLSMNREFLDLMSIRDRFCL